MIGQFSGVIGIFISGFFSMRRKGKLTSISERVNEGKHVMEDLLV